MPPFDYPPPSRPGNSWPSQFWLPGAAFGASVYFVRKHLAADDGPSEGADAVFWDAFAGLAIVVPAVSWPPWRHRGPACCSGCSRGGCRWPPYFWRPGSSAGGSPPGHPGPCSSNEAAAARHRSALARWQRYELDPAHSIDYPAMSDPRQPETAALIRAMKAAERLRGGTDAAYAPAVDRLEQALADAERAAGVGHDTPARRAGLPDRVRHWLTCAPRPLSRSLAFHGHPGRTPP